MLLDNMERFIYEFDRASEPEKVPFEDLVMKMAKMTVEQRTEFLKSNQLDEKTIERIEKMTEGGLL